MLWGLIKLEKRVFTKTKFGFQRTDRAIIKRTKNIILFLSQTILFRKFSAHATLVKLQVTEVQRMARKTCHA